MSWSRKNTYPRIPNGVFAALACLLWSSAFVAIKTGFTSGANPLFFAGLRFFLSGVLLTPLAAISPGGASFFSTWRGHWGFILVIGLIQTTLTYGAFYLGVGLIPASVAAIVIGAQPLITSAASHFIPPVERISLRQWLALVLGIAGLVILSISRNSAGAAGDGGIGGKQIVGILLMLCALLAASVSTILVSRTGRDIDPLTLSSGQFLFGGALLLLLSSLIEKGANFQPDLRFWIALLWLILVSSVGVSLWFWLLRVRKAGAGALSVWKFIIPVAGAVLGWVFVSGDVPDPGSLAGMALIAGGVLIFFLEFPNRGIPED